MLPLELHFHFPDTLITIGVILLVALILNLILRHLVTLAVRRTKRLTAIRRAEQSELSKLNKYAIRKIVDVATTLQSERTSERADKRADTVGSLLKSIITVTIWAIAILTCLDTVGVPTTSVIASAGIGGVALAFGAQSVVKDFLSGIFMIFEDQFGVGDFIQVGTISGTVEDVSLRVTRVRDLTGGIWYIRNGEITQLGNQSQGWATGIVLIPINPDEDPTKAIAVLQKVVAEVHEDPEWKDKLIEVPTVAGVTEVDASAQTIQIFASCPATFQHGVRREILLRGTRALAEAGIKGPKLPGHPQQ